MKVQYLGLARNVAGKSSEEVSLSPGASVRDMLRHLIDTYGEDFRSALLTADWRPRRYARILLDSQDVMEQSGLDTRVPNRSKASIIVMIDPITGGAYHTTWGSTENESIHGPGFQHGVGPNPTLQRGA